MLRHVATCACMSPHAATCRLHDQLLSIGTYVRLQRLHTCTVDSSTHVLLQDVLLLSSWPCIKRPAGLLPHPLVLRTLPSRQSSQGGMETTVPAVLVRSSKHYTYAGTGVSCNILAMCCKVIQQHND